MVLISVGTQKQQFTRFFDLVKSSEKLKNAEIVAQLGYTKYECDRFKSFSFIPFDDMERYIQKADLVICHGGVGTIFSALKKGKKVIAIPRLAKYNEHINDHQIEICEELEKEGYILYYKDGVDTLDDLIEKSLNSSFRHYGGATKDYITILRKEI